MTVDENYFANWKPEPPGPLRFCRCHHVEPTHFGDSIPMSDGGNGEFEVYQLPVRCHYKDCECREFRRERWWHRIGRRLSWEREGFRRMVKR